MIKLIPLSNSELKAIVDAEDYAKVVQRTWHLDKIGKTMYARTALPGYGKKIRMHNFIMGKRYGLIIDHKDGNGLNNTKNNLRFTKHGINLLNNFGAKGYSYSKERGKFRVRIKYAGKVIHGGDFASEDLARIQATNIRNTLINLS